MNQKFLYQKIKLCFLDYNHDLDLMPLKTKDYEMIVTNINSELKEQNNADLYVIIHDVVYEYLAKN
jgi:hypothetical protein